jgi:hypothetical protein
MVKFSTHFGFYDFFSLGMPDCESWEKGGYEGRGFDRTGDLVSMTFFLWGNLIVRVGEKKGPV